MVEEKTLKPAGAPENGLILPMQSPDNAQTKITVILI
jgi:hypothetical protein